ncbi:hypothetical protein WOLCODRAFT_21595 [Wolfiporia cocos MD-104 SS10]|uniref:DUF6589 domain-containing protein n=1 Tax=Wolfiporia cocos (strain MD-104) TaxID=742152 RepID=A0A2H3JSP6_WOLCO|nr:hypothetical protein WOLCODRAFT_21595 [Wolfiporia cocos MD-104 SS10]
MLASPWQAATYAARSPQLIPYPSAASVFTPYGSTPSSTSTSSSTVFDIPTAANINSPCSISLIESHFLKEVFHDFRLPEIASPQSIQAWHTKLDLEDRVLLIIRCMHALGFNTLGDLFSACLDDSYSKYPKVYHTVAAFVRSRGAVGKRPVDIVDKIFNHPKAKEYHNRIPIPPLFPSIPRHSLPPSARIMPTSHTPTPMESTQNQLLDWSLQQVLRHVENEADALLDPDIGFVLGSSHSMSWDQLLSWDMLQKEETVARKAPALFSLLTAISVNQYTRQKLSGTLSGGVADDQSGEESDDEMDDENNEDDMDPDFPSLRKELIKMKFQRDPWQGATTALLTLLSFRYRFCTSFQTLVSVILFMNKASRCTYQLLGRIGMSLSYSSTLRRLEDLGEDSGKLIAAWGADTLANAPGYQITFDNLNKLSRAWQATLGRQDIMQCGTAAILEDVPPGAFELAPLLTARHENLRSSLTFQELYNDIDFKHIRGIGGATLLRIWVKYIPAFKQYHAAVEALFSETYQKHRLRLRKTEALTLRCSAGVAQVLHDIVLDQLGVKPEWLENLMLLCGGDQLSIDRIHRAKLYLDKADTVFNRFEWALPSLQLWHMKWQWGKCIVRLHWYPQTPTFSNTGLTHELRYSSTAAGVFGLHHDCDLLGRKKFHPTKCDFYPMHDLLEDRFEALALEALRLLFEEKTGTMHPMNLPLLDSLEKYATTSSWSFRQLHQLADAAYIRFMSPSACDTEYAPDQSAGGRGSTGKPVTTATDHNQQILEFNGDHVFENTVNFMRVTFWYLEFNAAVSEGDIGRISEVMKLLRFSFWGAGSTKYGAELLELACNFMKEYPPALQTAIMNNYLVNTTGLPGHWEELDLLQEHINYLIKTLYNNKSMDFDSPFLKKTISSTTDIRHRKAWRTSH